MAVTCLTEIFCRRCHDDAKFYIDRGQSLHQKCHREMWRHRVISNMSSSNGFKSAAAVCFTLSPIIMVQWKIGPLNERKLILEGPIFHFHDYGRKGNYFGEFDGFSL